MEANGDGKKVILWYAEFTLKQLEEKLIYLQGRPCDTFITESTLKDMIYDVECAIEEWNELNE